MKIMDRLFRRDGEDESMTQPHGEPAPAGAHSEETVRDPRRPRPTDTGSFTPPPVEDPLFCTHCGGPMPSDHELLLASVKLLQPRLADIAPEAYRRLFEAAPSLIPLFEQESPDLIRHGEGGSWHINPDADQIGRLFEAIRLLATHFDPDSPEALDRLRSSLRYAGFRHMRWDPPAQPAEYVAVVDVLLSVLRDFAGTAWTAHLERAWTRAGWFLMGNMLDGQATTDTRRVDVRARP